MIFCRRNEQGSTILEVLIALVILTTLGMVTWHAAGVSLRLAGRLHERVRARSRLLQLDDALRGLAGRVCPPYWAPSHLIKTDENTLRVAYLDGDPAKNLILTVQKDCLVMNDQKNIVRYPGFASVELSPAVDREQREFGIAVRLVQEGRQPVSIIVPIGGLPFGSRPTP